MIQQAVALDDPVIFLEPKHRYWDRGEVDLDTPPELPVDRARITRPGTDVTLVTFGAMLTTALQAADIAAAEGHSIEVIDLRSLSPPLDVDTVEESVRRTGRLVVAQEAPVTCGLGAEIAAQSRNGVSINSRRRCCGSADSTSPIPRRNSRHTTCPTPTASSMPSTAVSRPERTCA